MDEPKNPAANPWRSVAVIDIGGEGLTCGCTMHALAALFAALEVDSLYALYKKWDALHPETMRKTLAFLAVDGKKAVELFDKVEGARGMEELHRQFYALVSGMTPDEMAAEAASQKKLAALPGEVATRIVAELAAHPATAHLVA